VDDGNSVEWRRVEGNRVELEYYYGDNSISHQNLGRGHDGAGSAEGKKP
jgi:hypothetical protein